MHKHSKTQIYIFFFHRRIFKRKEPWDVVVIKFGSFGQKHCGWWGTEKTTLPLPTDTFPEYQKQNGARLCFFVVYFCRCVRRCLLGAVKS